LTEGRKKRAGLKSSGYIRRTLEKLNGETAEDKPRLRPAFIFQDDRNNDIDTET
jgi:hypothetical protein